MEGRLGMSDPYVPVERLAHGLSVSTLVRTIDRAVQSFAL
jgi:hypothetical protein